MLTDTIEKLLASTSRKTKTLQFAMRLPALNVDYRYSSTTPGQHFHSASVGKLMTAVLILKAVDDGLITLDTPISMILKQPILDGLFVYSSHDYQQNVTIEHLLRHTSGINDYFESKTFDGALFVDDVIKHPDTFWTPKDLLDYTRNRQIPIGTPGNQFFYSDTGYILLGLIVEAVFKMPFHQALDTHIFQPAHMSETTLCFYSNRFNQNALAPLYINGTDVHLFQSLSCDFSGGGLSTTADDLILFLDALRQFHLISEESVGKMAQFTNPYRQGMVYGLGMMQLRFEQFFFLLKGLPRLQGHLGVTGVHAWYDPDSGSCYVINVGNTKDMVMSFKLLIKIIQLVKQAQR